MSRKTTKSRNSATTTPSDRRLHVVADRPANGKHGITAEDKVRAALTDNPGVTTAKLALAAGVGRSTAAKILARWDRDGLVLRTASEGHRVPDTWALADSSGDSHTTPPDTDTPAAVISPAIEQDAPGDVPAGGAPTDGDTETAADEPAPTPRGRDNGHDASGDGEQDSALAEVTDTQPAAAQAEERPAQSASESEPAAVPDTKNRLGKGALRGMVEDYLAEHPGESFGPAKIGKDLGRSGGAVNNALEKLVADGYAVKTCEAPKRFQHKAETAAQ